MAVAGRRSLGAGSLPMADRGSRRHGGGAARVIGGPTAAHVWLGLAGYPARPRTALARSPARPEPWVSVRQSPRSTATSHQRGCGRGDGARRRCPLAGVLSSPLRSAMCQGLAFVHRACPYASVTSLMATTWLGSAALVSALGHTASASRLPPLPETRTSVKPAASSLLAISWLSARPSSQPSAILPR